PREFESHPCRSDSSKAKLRLCVSANRLHSNHCTVDTVMWPKWLPPTGDIALAKRTRCPVHSLGRTRRVRRCVTGIAAAGQLALLAVQAQVRFLVQITQSG